MKNMLILALLFQFVSAYTQSNVLQKPKVKKGFNRIESKNSVTTSMREKDSIQVQMDPLTINIEEGLVKYFEAYNENKKVRGYKIQLYSGANRSEAEEVRSDFMKKYEVRPQLMYDQPNFKIRVGNYRDRNSAIKDLHFYKIEFEGAFLVRDYLNAPIEK